MATDNQECRICASTSVRFHMHAAGQNLWRCQDCGFVQLETQPSTEVLDAIYSDKYFTNSKYEGHREALAKENERRVSILARWLPERADVLDVGCSTGDFLAHAKTRYNVYGVDYSPFAIETARRRNPDLADRLRSGRIEDTEWTDNRFDAICLWDVIEHLWDPATVMQELFPLVKVGGLIVISTPAIDSLVAKASGKYWAFMTPPEHMSFFSLKAFRRLAEKLGNCQIVHSSRRGKWANISFIGYKITRIAPSWFPKQVLWPLFNWPLRKLSIYVPTKDIQYVVLQKVSD